jgi:succinate-semialdehyde dehydrogenase/glutarate-semialdehyde dehydrogenase
VHDGSRSRQGPLPDGSVAGSSAPDFLAASRLRPARIDELLARGFPGAGAKEVRLPWTDRPFYTVPASDARDVEEAVRRARIAQRPWASTPLRERRAILAAFRADLSERGDEALDAVQLETGKARRDALEELADIALVGRYYDRRGEELLRSRRRAGVLPFLTRVWELRRPHGVVGVIAPWNYPLALAASDALPALLAGNAVVLKPDLQTSLSALWVADALRRAGLPQDVFQVVTGDGPTAGGALVDAADFVMFTGSTETGRAVARRAGERLIGCTLELGGKNALVVLDVADVDRATTGILRGCYANAGQLCISLERVLVHRRLYGEMRERLRLAVPALAMGPGLTYDVDVGSLISQAQLEKTRAHLEDALDRGASVLAGGRARPDLGPWFHEPTVLENVPGDAVAATRETFGPVVSLASFGDDDEAVRLANRGAYGLNASVWTSDLQRGRRFATRIRAGTVNVNDAYGPAWASVDAPMGGFGDSGLGRRHGAEGLLKYTASQTIATQIGHPLTTPAGLGHDLSARAVTAWLRWLGR